MATPGVEQQHMYDALILIVSCGDSGVGKSCIMSRFTNQSYVEGGANTIGVDFATKKIWMDSKSLKLQIWDTAGQERFGAITSCYFRGAQGILIVFDVTDKKTFDNVKKRWIPEILQHHTIGTDPETDTTSLLLVGNKCDLHDRRQVSYETAKAYADRVHMPYVEVSAKADRNIEIPYVWMSSLLLDRRYSRPADAQRLTISHLSKQDKINQDNNCCQS